MEINEIIKQRRKELFLTMADVAKAVGVSEATVSRWEAGNISNMRRNRIAALAKVLQISPTVMITGNNPDFFDTETETKKNIANITENDLKAALFDGNKEVTEEMWDEVKRYARYIQDRENSKKG